MAQRPSRSTDLGEFLDREVYPSLYERLDLAFPEYGFVRRGNKWEATSDNTRMLPGSPRAERVTCYANRPYGLVIHGGEFVRLLDLANGGTRPTGADFPAAVRKLAEMAGARLPEREVSAEEAERTAKRNARRSALETVVAFCRATLASTAGKAARDYLERRGLDTKAQEELELGLYPSTQAVEKALRDAGHNLDAARADGLLFDKMAGYVVFPWADAAGHPATLYGRFPGTPPATLPKTMALPGEGTKAAPLYFDRARRAGRKELVLVEGLFDAALLQAKGEVGVVACMGAQLSGTQVETLERYGIRAVTICLDPDGAGETGTLACIRSLYGKGINTYVTPVLPDGQDPDEYVLAHGLEAWHELVANREHAFRYKARTLVAKHKGAGWTDAGLAACVDEAIDFDAAVHNPTLLTDLALFFWPEVQHGTGVDMDAVAVRVAAVREKAEAEREQRAYTELVRGAEGKLRDGDLEGAKTLLREETDRLRSEERHWQAEPVRSVADELEEHDVRLRHWRGREYIGLPQRTLPKLDEMTLGLRGLMLLAAAPNVGKTTLGIQFGLDAVVHNEDAAFLFVSLEMSRWEIMTRFKSRLSGLDWQTLVFGSMGARREAEAHFTRDELTALRDAEETLRKLGNRLRILDDKNFPAPTLEKVLEQIEDLKAASGAGRVFVLVDYLQVWPVPDAMAKHIRTDLDADKWRIGQMKELRDAINGDPVLVISEARKPNDKGDGWGADMSDVMGSARGTYTPDMVLLLRAVSDLELGQRAGASSSKGDELAEAGRERRERTEASGYAEQRLAIVKGRDGVQRGRLDLRFNFRQSRFEESSS